MTTTPEHSKNFSNGRNYRPELSSRKSLFSLLEIQKVFCTTKVLESRFPAYQTNSYNNSNKDKVLIHQERLAESNIANTKNESDLEKIFTENENYNVGFWYQNAIEIDKAIKEIKIMD
ncbi:MAG: hypothetical protein KME55_39925 [Nostoc indistinguendum CM1-VF10]|nr:hypothetical protein [Nostoc indistinguendum CM1-VF10]